MFVKKTGGLHEKRADLSRKKEMGREKCTLLVSTMPHPQNPPGVPGGLEFCNESINQSTMPHPQSYGKKEKGGVGVVNTPSLA